MSIVHVGHIKNTVLTRFGSLVDLSDVQRVSKEQLESLYLFTGLKPNRIWPSNKGLDKSPRFV
jgi:hypothetical protein